MTAIHHPKKKPDSESVRAVLLPKTRRCSFYFNFFTFFIHVTVDALLAGPVKPMLLASSFQTRQNLGTGRRMKNSFDHIETLNFRSEGFVHVETQGTF